MTNSIRLTEEFLARALHTEHQSLVLLSDVRELTDAFAEQYLQWLTESEQQRIAAIKDPATANNSLLGRAVARSIAALWWRLVPGDVDIVQTAGGKPELRYHKPPPLHFSVTHHRHWVAVAFARAPVGVDIEYPSQTDRLKLARRFFLADEYEWLCSLPAADQNHSFTRLWTLKEAEVKRTGSALARVMGQVGFIFGHNQILVKGAVNEARYGLYEMDDGMLLALALSTSTSGTSPTFLQGFPHSGYQTLMPRSLAVSV